MKYNKPTHEQASKQEIIEANANDVMYADWHPQWGGYGGLCLVEFSKITGDSYGNPGCFEVYNFHNGEFPSDQYLHYHYCDATQLIDFGITVLEMQKKHQVCRNSEPITMEKEKINKFIERLKNLLDDNR